MGKAEQSRGGERYRMVTGVIDANEPCLSLDTASTEGVINSKELREARYHDTVNVVNATELITSKCFIACHMHFTSV